MAKIIALTGCPAGIAHTIMAAKALEKVGTQMGHTVLYETVGSGISEKQISQEDFDSADLIIIAADIHIDRDRFASKPIYTVSTSMAIHSTKEVIEKGLRQINLSAQEAPYGSSTETETPTIKLVGITSCPTGIAHTFMAAEALKNAAHSLGYQIHIETQGSVGVKTPLSEQEIEQADAVIIAADTHVDLSRFAGKKLYQTSTKEALHHGEELLEKALNASIYGENSLYDDVKSKKEERSSMRTGAYLHLMTGVSHMLPIVVAGGLLIALAFAFGGIYAGEEENTGTLGWALSQIGGGSAFKLIVPILSGYIAYSIAQRPGLTAGLIGGLLAANIGAGFLGGIISGFLAGYLVKFLNDKIQLPENFEGLKPVLILPFLSTLIVGLLMIYLIGPPVKITLDWLSDYLSDLQEGSALILGLLLGGMMAFDMGGPVNKAAYTFSVGLISEGIYAPMAAVMAAGMTPPLGIALAALLFKNRFDKDEQEASKAAFVLGISFITEGAIPFAAKDPFRVIPAIILGSAIAGAMSFILGCELIVPHGGIFVLFIPNAVTHLLAYSAAILTGTFITAIALGVLKKPLEEKRTP